MLKGLLSDIILSIKCNGEEIASISTCFAVVQISWEYEAIRFAMGIAASILSGYIVNRLKKRWDKEK